MEAVEYSQQFFTAQESVADLEARFSSKLTVNPDLDRSLISFQGNKSEPIFRWFHYREGFAKDLIEYVLQKIDAPEGGRLLDPFAGTGATLFVGADFRSMRGDAIELLPVGVAFMNFRNFFGQVSRTELSEFAKSALDSRKKWTRIKPKWKFKHLSITNHAFSEDTEKELCQYKTWALKQDSEFARFLDFVAFSILEKISYTRKDGQYLRWDKRSPRYAISGRQTTFDKGRIWGFWEALQDKLNHIIHDLETAPQTDLFPNKKAQPDQSVRVLSGTVFEQISSIDDASIDCLITSPPYCNRYDYTRTYALELAYLGIDEDQIRALRQALLTCTVENKPKQFEWLPDNILDRADRAFTSQKCLQNVIGFLEEEKRLKALNNPGICTMVKGYFYDSAIHLSQVSEKLKPGAAYVMVNDNVRYNGLDIPVDCILSALAEDLGFETEVIWVLPKGKGNSSQQMKRHGRSELRKCVYVWRKR